MMMQKPKRFRTWAPKALSGIGHLNVSIPQNLAEISKGRDHILTDEFAHATGKKPQTIRKGYCLTGECYGIKPIKIGNRLLWPVAPIAKLLNGGAQ